MSNLKNLTDTERLILANQYELLSKLAESEYETEYFLRVSKQLKDGHKWLYQQIFDSIGENLDDESANFVVNVLSLHRALLNSYEQLKVKNQLKKADVTFKGFDGNNEGELMYFAEALGDAGRFSEVIESGELNSHFPMTSKYQKMLTKWKELEQEYELSEDQILQIIGD
ncbi:YfbU family protein [Acinetobacter nosocomialis]|uniref:YfbU family protein n=1 Tax=Acinetobacter nosocomialis TaxID=106654 RepID=A0A2L1VGA0_ACINO|nr:YfbU family protein [Acinetobacter nosocomialis]AVF44224.1 hypothetical protein AL533_07420 [Acinetobacter nosocomialis]AZC09789.1 hypothetical protein DKE47_010215 [Acinetobacter nosocomialis]MBD0443597.1 YfbU family protein [Acinetobacter nosocomialis]MBP1502828.1 YfbU family protein [Acinetobacter nosocomialis]MBR7688217.1 YfbU family protein [Acinetobacter nosocomialis]